MSAESFLIKTPAEFSFDECLWFLDRDLDDCMHKVFPGSVRKLVETNHEAVLLEISAIRGALRVSKLTGGSLDKKAITAMVTEWFDLDRDITPFYRLLKKDPDLKMLATEFRGLRIIGIPDFFEVICWCIIGQQINLAFAYKIKRRLVEWYGRSLTHQGEKYYLFPSPEKIAALTVEELKEFQMTGKKAEYLIGIAALFVTGQLSKEKISALKDEQAMLAELMKIRGIGEWTANYTIMKGLRAQDGVPYGDSGMNQALITLKRSRKKVTVNR